MIHYIDKFVFHVASNVLDMVKFLDLYYLKLLLVQSSSKSGHVLEISLFIWKLFDLKMVMLVAMEMCTMMQPLKQHQTIVPNWN